MRPVAGNKRLSKLRVGPGSIPQLFTEVLLRARGYVETTEKKERPIPQEPSEIMRKTKLTLYLKPK